MANLEGYVTKNKGYTILDSGFYYGEDPNPEQIISVSQASDTRTLAFRVLGLKANTPHYFKAYATNEKGTGFGEALSFTTAPATQPTVLTTTAAFDGATRQWSLVGNVEDNGGDALSEYGFCLSTDNENWTYLTQGFDIIGPYVSLGLPIFRDLEPGTYFVKAYAINSAGQGEGETLSIVIPNLPEVKTLTSETDSNSGGVVLRGSIINTGAVNTLCHATQFKYRLVGSETWQIAGFAQGDIGTSDFSFTLTDLKPGENYEYMAEAENSYGAAAGMVVSFTVSYGGTVREALAYLKAAGKPLPEIADILKTIYECSLDTCVELFAESRYSAPDIAFAMNTSSYRVALDPLALAMQKAGFSAQAVAEALLAHYNNPLRSKMSGHSDLGLILVLKTSGYALADSMQAMVTLLGYDIKKCIEKFTTSSRYTYNEVYVAASEVFGFDALLQFLWQQKTGGRQPNSRNLEEITVIMRDVGNMEPMAIGHKLQEQYPALSGTDLANAFFNAKYPFEEVALTIAQMYDAEPFAFTAILNRSYFSKDAMIPVLIRDMGYSPVVMVQVITIVWTNWKDPIRACADILKEYYGLDAAEAAKVFYAAGWTEKVTSRGGYGLNQLIYTIKECFGEKSDYALIGILKAAGVPALAIATSSIGASRGWKDYRAHGFSAADAAAWVQITYAPYGIRSQLGATVQTCHEAGYDLVEIALALRSVFDVDAATALEYLLANTKKDVRDINEALAIAYQANPITMALEAMIGSPMKNVVAALRNTYRVSDPETALMYLKQAGYSREDILHGMIEGYFPTYQRDPWLAYLAFIQEMLPEVPFGEILSAAILHNGSELTARSITNRLINFGYETQSVARILKDEYGVSLSDALDAIIYRLGIVEAAEITPQVMSAYGLNLVTYIEYEKNRGVPSGENARALKAVFGIASPGEVGTLLAQAGYEKQAVIDAILEVFFANQMTPEAIEALEEIISIHFTFNATDAIKLLLMNGALRPISQVIIKMQDAGYGLEIILQTLKDLYALSESEAVKEMNALQLFSIEELSIAVQSVYGQDYVIMLIQSWLKEPWGSAEGIFRNLRQDIGITDPAQIYRYMRAAGIAEHDAMNALYLHEREGMVHVVKEVYGIPDAVSMGELLGRFKSPSPGMLNLFILDFADHLAQAFPGVTHHQLVRAFQAYGYPVMGDSWDISDWLLHYATNGLPDKELAAILGPKSNGLNLPVDITTEILQGKGYNIQDTVYWLIQCGYYWSEFFERLVHNYAPRDYPQSYYENNSSSKFIVQYLKDYYDIKDIARGIFGYSGSASRVLADLQSGGYSLSEALTATLWIGGSTAQQMVVTLVDNSISRANAARDQSLRLNAVDAAKLVYGASLAVEFDKRKANTRVDDPICLDDIAVSLVKYGPQAEDRRLLRYFSNWEVLAAMEALFDMYFEINKIDLPKREAALASLRIAGATADDCAAMLAAHNVGLSTKSVVKGIFGLGNDWFGAITALAGAGFSFGAAIDAVYNNPSYRTVIGLTLLSTITTAAIGQLSQMANIGNYISLLKEIAKTGFKIAEGDFTIDDVLKYFPEYWYYKAGEKIKEYVPAF